MSASFKIFSSIVLMVSFRTQVRLYTSIKSNSAIESLWDDGKSYKIVYFVLCRGTRVWWRWCRCIILYSTLASGYATAQRRYTSKRFGKEAHNRLSASRSNPSSLATSGSIIAEIWSGTGIARSITSGLLFSLTTAGKAFPLILLENWSPPLLDSPTLVVFRFAEFNLSCTPDRVLSKYTVKIDPFYDH